MRISSWKPLTCFLLIFCLLSCKKTEDNLGDFMFYIENDLGCGNITVTIDGVTKTIYSPAGSDPSCNHTGSATFRLRPGEYEMSARCDEGSAFWNDIIEVRAGTCGKQRLALLDNTGPGGNIDWGNNNRNGSIMFWTRVDHGCGPISVTINSQTRTISKYITSGNLSGCKYPPYELHV